MSIDSSNKRPTRARKRVNKTADASAPVVESSPSEVAPVVESSPSEVAPDELEDLWAPMPLVDVKNVMTNIHASTKPPKDKFIRVLDFDAKAHRNCRPVYLFEYAFEGELSADTFYVKPNSPACKLLTEQERLVEALLVLGVTVHGTPFVWELKIPNGRNKNADQWSLSRLEKAQLAVGSWLKLVANPGGGGYDHATPIATYDDPDWSAINFDNAIKVACKDRVVDSIDHKAVKEALGL